jgi:tRNA pseudouridine38-40 synthase
MRTLKLVLEYDGTAYVGWQFQANGPSVQQAITRVLEQVLREPVTLIGAGRTDSGVHARGQVAGFRTENVLPAETLLAALNGLLPGDIRVKTVEEVPEGFHARYSARERMYRYSIGLTPAAIGRQYRWHVRYRLDLELMNRTAADVLGDHDFTSFCRIGSDVKHHRCTVLRSVWTAAPDLLIYEIRANRFLHGMVRALVGTMVDIGRGYTPYEEFASILEARDRRRAGTAAPPHGLCLEEVLY